VKNGIATLIASGLLTAASVGAGIAMPGQAAAGSGSSVQVNDVVYFEQSYPGQHIRYEGGPHDNDVTVDIGASEILIVDVAAVGLSTNSPCYLDASSPSTTVHCPKTKGPLSSDKVFNVTIKTNDGNDTLVSTGTGTVSGTSQPLKVTLTGFGGNDTITATGGYSAVIGGDGDDILTSGPGTVGYSDYAYGNAGNDTIYTTGPTSSPAGNSGDRDWIYCDNNLDLGYTDTVYKESQDVIGTYYHNPPPSGSSGCDTVYSS
jgi:hypothetical protein